MPGLSDVPVPRFFHPSVHIVTILHPRFVMSVRRLPFRAVVLPRSLLASLVLAAACDRGRGARESAPPTPRPMVVQKLDLPADSAFPLVLRDTADHQVATATDGGEVRVVTAARVDDAAEARLCGVIVARSRSMETLPFAWPVDSAVPYLVPQLVNGPDVQGYRILVPGRRAEYRFEGFTTDGSTRVSFRWPVRSDRVVPGDAADSEIEAALTPSPRALDSLVMQWRLRTPAAGAPWRGATSSGDEIDSARAVKLVREIPLFPVGFTPPCGEATFRVSLSSGVDKPVRVLVRKGETIAALAATATGKVTIGFDEQGPDATQAGRAPRASVTAAADGHVTLRLRYNATESTEPGRQEVLVRLTSAFPQ